MDSTRCERLIREGVAAWNEWRRMEPGGEAQLADLDLTGLDLSGADLRGADLIGAQLSGAILRGANLEAAHISGATCRGTDFRDARLVHASITGTDCKGADFRGALFQREGHLSNCDLSATRFDEVEIDECFLVGSTLAGARLCGASLKRADLSDTDLRGADFTGADLSRASFYRANLSDARLAQFVLHDCSFVRATLRGAHLQQADLRNANFRGAAMEGAYLGGAWLERATFDDAQLQGAFFDGANLTRASFDRANLTSALFERANLFETSLDGAILTEANLERSILVRTKLRGARLTGARVYGIAAWDVEVDENDEMRQDLVITPEGQPQVVVDQIDVAQFTYLLLHNPNIRRVIDTIGRRGVLLLGRFTPDRKLVLDAIRRELRRRGFVPILFDFDRPVDRSLRETVLTLAGLSLFIIVDLTAPSSTPLELQAIIPAFEIPVVPIIAAGNKPFAMFADLYNQHSRERGGHLFGILTYASIDGLTSGLHDKVIAPAVALSRTLAAKKGQAVDIEAID
jgi:uncharacterized protein YjbI with pentapeptide repeats